MPTTRRFDKALLDPQDVFATPQEVVDDTEFSRKQKIEILRRWDYDASELSVAEDEGMPAGSENLLSQIMQALSDLGVTIDPSRRPPTRQGGLDRASIKPGPSKD